MDKSLNIKILLIIHTKNILSLNLYLGTQHSLNHQKLEINRNLYIFLFLNDLKYSIFFLFI
jgi:hypothetical protein